MSLDKAKQAIKAAYKPGVISEWDAETCLQAVLPHLEAHFRELHAKELEAEAIANRFPPDEDSFRSAATFLRRNTT